jgi:hypothetical protein
MAAFVLLLWVIAAVLCGIRGLGVEGPGRAHLGWLGVAVALFAVVLSTA